MLNPDYRDILSAFIEDEVEFILVGAYALAVHGLPRATGDIDLWVRSSEANASRVMRALSRFGVSLSDVCADDFQKPRMVVQIGVAPRRIDLLTEIDGVSFAEAWSEREIVEVEGLSIPVISQRHLVRNKRATGRMRDDADARWLEGSRD